MRWTRLLVALLGVWLVAGPAPARAQLYETAPPGAPRFARWHELAGAEGVALVFLGETGSIGFFDHGGGFRVFVGERLFPYVEMQFSWQQTWHGAGRYGYQAPYEDGILLGTFAIDFKLYRWIGRVQPYFVIGPTGYMLQAMDWTVQTGGLGFQAGTGVDVFVIEGLSLGARVAYQGIGLFDFQPDDNDLYVSTLGFGLNLAGRF